MVIKKKDITLQLMNEIATLQTPPTSKKSKSKNSKSKKSKLKNSKSKDENKTTYKKTTSKKTTSKKTTHNKSNKVAKVKGISNGKNNLNIQARIGDKTRSVRTFQDLGVIIDYNEDKNVWITNMGRQLYSKKQNKSWEIVYYRIYVLSLRPKPIRRPKYLQKGWPFNNYSIENDTNNNYTNSSGTNENNVDLMDRNSNELESTENNYNNNNSLNYNNNFDYRKLYMCVVSAPSPELARQFIIDNYLFGIEDFDENYNPYENSIWLNEYLSSCKDVGESFHQTRMLLCINRY